VPYPSTGRDERSGQGTSTDRVPSIHNTALEKSCIPSEGRTAEETRWEEVKQEDAMNSKCCSPKTCAVALGRWCLGVVLLFYGIGKFPDVAGFVNGYILPAFEKAWLPQWLLVPYAYALPYVEIILGALLILGLFRNAVLFITGLYFISLAFGQVLLQQPPVVFYNTAYAFLAAAVLFLDEYDRWVLPPRRQAETPRAATQ
jgi:thiosulfate dehydrogenase [quinone] large subunit